MDINTKTVRDMLKDEDVHVARRTDVIHVYPSEYMSYSTLMMIAQKYGLKFIPGRKCLIITGVI